MYYEVVGQCIFDIFSKEGIGEMVKDLQGRTAPDICQKIFLAKCKIFQLKGANTDLHLLVEKDNNIISMSVWQQVI